MRSTHLFNHDWLFIPQKVAGNMPDSAFERVILPHTNKLVPHRNFDDADYQFISTYRKHFTLPEPLNGRRLLLDFDGAMMGTTVTLNGHTFPEHKGGYVPFSFDITDYVQENGDNLLEVSLDSTERPDIPDLGLWWIIWHLVGFIGMCICVMSRRAISKKHGFARMMSSPPMPTQRWMCG